MRRYSSADQPPPVDPKTLDIPMYWIHPAKPLSVESGMHRLIWDVRYPAASGSGPRSSIRGGDGPWAPPGHYTVRLTASGHSYIQPLTLKMDPRVKTPLPDLMKQFNMAQQITAGQAKAQQASRDANWLREQLQTLRAKISRQEGLSNQVEALSRKVTALTGPTPARSPDSSGVDEPEAGETSFRSLIAAWGEVDRAIESADAAPTPDAVMATAHDQLLAREVLGRWELVKTQDLAVLNRSLRQSNIRPVSFESGSKTPEAGKN